MLKVAGSIAAGTYVPHVHCFDPEAALSNEFSRIKRMQCACKISRLLLVHCNELGAQPVRKPRVKVSIVIPAYNEESRLPHTLMKTATFLAQQAYTSEIIVVTDGSTDATEQVVEDAAARYGGIRLISLPKNRGKGFSVKYGMINALGDYRLFMDADYAVPI